MKREMREGLGCGWYEQFGPVARRMVWASFNNAIEMTPDHAGLSHSGLEACCDERLGTE
jgi:hypothetical protein